MFISLTVTNSRSGIHSTEVVRRDERRGGEERMEDHTNHVSSKSCASPV